MYIDANQRPHPYLVDCSCISSCCSCEDTLCAAAARLRTLDNWDRSSAIGSMVSRVPGDSPDRADPPDEKCMLARLVLVPLTPRPGWGILRTCRTPAGSSYRLLRKLKSSAQKLTDSQLSIIIKSYKMFLISQFDQFKNENQVLILWCTNKLSSSSASNVEIKKDMNSLGVLCCIERCSAKSSVTQFGSPPGCDAQIGQTCQSNHMIS